MNVLEKIKEVRNYYEKAYGIQLTKKQLNVIESKDELVRETFKRQEGCSTAAMIKAIEFAINNQRSRVLFINPTNRVANIRIDEMKQLLSNKLLNRHVLMITKNPGKIEFTNGSCIQVFGGNSMNMRGIKANCVIIEPLNSISEEMINTAIMCTCHDKNSQIVTLEQVYLMIDNL